MIPAAQRVRATQRPPGRAVYLAVSERDYPMLQGAFLILTVSVVFFNLIADLFYFKLDPRITT